MLLNMTDMEKDVQALGFIMIQLMEFGTSQTYPDTIKLQNPERWDSRIMQFLMLTSDSSIEILEKVRHVTLHHHRFLT